MNKKRLLIFLMCFVYLLSLAVGAAAEGITAQITDGVNGIVEISGKTPIGQSGARISILVLKDGVTPETAAQNVAQNVVYQNSAVTDDSGSFVKEFRLLFSEDDEEECNLNVYVGGEGFTAEDIVSIPLYYASTGLKIDKAIEYIASSDKGEKLDTGKKIFSVDTALFGELDKDELAKFFDKELEKADVEFAENTEENLGDNTDSYVTFEEVLRYSIAMEAYNQSKKSYILEGTTLKFDELLGLSEYINTKGTLGTLMSEAITDAGIENTLDGLFGTGAKDKNELQKTYAKLVILNAIKYNKRNGSGIIEAVLTEDNAEAAGLDISEYLELSSTLLADDALYQLKDRLTLDNLEETIEECALIREEVSRPSTGGSSSGGSFGGSSGGSISVGVKDTPKTEEEQKPQDTQKKESFKDIAGFAWAKEAIDYLADADILNGVGEGMFNPEGNLTREAAAKIICLATGIDTADATCSFEDVEEGSWYAPYVAALNKLGIVNGVDSANFGVGQNITREDFAVIICRALKWAMDSEELAFTDAQDVSGYAKGAVNALYAKKIITGYEDGSFGPKNSITRAEGAQIVYKTIKNK